MTFSNKVILITGGAGFIGSNMADVLIKQDVKKIIVLDNFCASKKENIAHLLDNPKFSLVTGDVRDPELIEELVQKSDIVFNLAASKLVVALEKPRTDLETNIIGIFNVLEAARKKPEVRIVHASTGSVLGSSDKPMPEDHPPKPTTLYGISKLTGENYCRFYAKEFGIKVSVIRYFHVFGPRQDYAGKAGVINIFLSRVLQGQAPLIFGTGEQLRCFTFVLDDVEATLMLASRKDTIGETYNVAAETRLSINDLAETIIEKYAADKTMKPEYGPAAQGENLRPVPDTKKIENLGFRPKYTFEQGLEITKNWIAEDIKNKN
ncbi:SDR family NAD(P)-dependent oxidoreductase [Candidatus Falkowbacteria bacterium]|nr:SDR family NAD(P)-dependent oxidoreductase [Candidatus Falkowbacteria bacterium]